MGKWARLRECNGKTYNVVRESTAFLLEGGDAKEAILFATIPFNPVVEMSERLIVSVKEAAESLLKHGDKLLVSEVATEASKQFGEKISSPEAFIVLRDSGYNVQGNILNKHKRSK